MNALRVLMVEDNPGDADLTRETLEASKIKIELTVAVDGVEALNILKGRKPGSRHSQPDLILLDLNIPKKDGRQTLFEIKNDKQLRHIPVVILTSSDAEKDIAQSYALGANCYVTKPVDLRAFQSIVGAIEEFWFSIVKLPTRFDLRKEGIEDEESP
jgi:two-component system, chemotaxis family, response regulator Rcp1